MTVSNRKNDCAAFDADLHDHLLGEIEPTAKLRLEEHLLVCTSCRVALEEARRGLLALEDLAESPLPYEDQPASSSYRDESWRTFQQRLLPPTPSSADPWGFRLLSAAALLLLGVGLGMQLGTRDTGLKPAVEIAQKEIEPETIASLARIELLADVGVGYTQGLRQLLDHMASLEAEQATPAELEATREIARNLVRDGRLLRRNLDPEQDRNLLAAVNRAELVLEEIAAVGSSGLGAPNSSVQLAVNDDVLRNQLTTVKFDRRVQAREGRPRRPANTSPRGEGTSP